METTRDILIFCTGIMGGMLLGAWLFIAAVEFIKRRWEQLD